MHKPLIYAGVALFIYTYTFTTSDTTDTPIHTSEEVWSVHVSQ